MEINDLPLIILKEYDDLNIVTKENRDGQPEDPNYIYFYHISEGQTWDLLSFLKGMLKSREVVLVSILPIKPQLIRSGVNLCLPK